MYDFENDEPKPGDRFQIAWSDPDVPGAAVDTQTYVTDSDGSLVNESNPEDVLSEDVAELLGGLAYTDSVTYLGTV